VNELVSLMDDMLREELLLMQAADERTRAELAAEGVLFDGYHPRMEAMHQRNAARFAEIIATHGWPDRELVGEDGAAAAWLIVQHAIGAPEFQRRCLALLQEAAARGAAPWSQVAYLEDRIRTFEGRPQRYGTQHDWDAQGELNPLPMEDAAHVDERRRAVGLGPLAEQTARLRAEAAAANEISPRDWDERQAQFVAWARQTGWRN
jgi:hypothetical protein